MLPEQHNLHKAAYTVGETMSQLMVGRTALYDLVKSGRLRATKCGKRTLFLACDIAAFLDALRRAA